MRSATTLLAFASSVSALSGVATFYSGNVAGGTCSFSTYTLPASISGAALSLQNWESAGNCGRCVSVKGPAGNSVVAMIVDQCPECPTNALDLFSGAFSALASPSAGKIPITWNFVPCPITSPLALRNKEGVSAYWFSMQVVNAAVGVSRLDVSVDGGKTWKATQRKPYNFFEAQSGFGTTSVDVKVTSISGQSVVVKNVKVESGVQVTASSNFASGGSSIEEAAPEAAPEESLQEENPATPSSAPSAPAAVVTPEPVLLVTVPSSSSAAPTSSAAAYEAELPTVVADDSTSCPPLPTITHTVSVPVETPTTSASIIDAAAHAPSSPAFVAPSSLATPSSTFSTTTVASSSAIIIPSAAPSTTATPTSTFVDISPVHTSIYGVSNTTTPLTSKSPVPVFQGAATLPLVPHVQGLSMLAGVLLAFMLF